MKKYLLTCFLFAFSNALIAQKSEIENIYRPYFNKFDSLNNAENGKAADVLKSIEKKNDFKINDTLKAMVFHSWGNYYLKKREYDKALQNLDKSLDLRIKLKLYASASVTMHNKSLVYQSANKIDSSMIFEDKAIELAKKGKYDKQLYINLVSKASKLQFKGDFLGSNKILFSIINKIKDVETKGTVHGNIAINYDQLGVKEKAEFYYKKTIYYLKQTKNPRFIWATYGNISDFYYSINKYELAKKYSDSIKLTATTDDALSYYHLTQSSALLGMKKYEEALLHINKSIELDKKLGDNYYLTDDIKNRGQLYMTLKNYPKAYEDFKKAREMSDYIEGVLTKRNVYRDYIHSYLMMHNKELGDDFTTFLKLNDSINNQANNKNFTELDVKYRTAEKDIKLKTQQLELEKERSNRNLAIGGIGFLVLLSAGGFLWNRNRQKRKEAEQKNTVLELQNNLQQMELSNLNKQLDPHEFKNLLLSLAPEIQETSPETYRKMAKLANLLKSSLSNSSVTESLENQLEQIEIYLNLEKNTLHFPLEYHIDNQATTENIQIPRLLLKNLVENSIKHGIKPKESGGKIDIRILEKENQLFISVEDNGTGRKNSPEKDTGIGISTYANLFKLLNEKNKNKALFEISDRPDGTTVNVSVPIHYDYQLNNTTLSKN
ncbi:histidine kinase [Chryseobacterium oryctis]|uniref:Histidine kinase n=1 Tax=Chryseobacterium oryctis TaxID=2952618 RepID=A0ABT3HJ07_9FLAO|nr:ATP-binding protein [Chryseobacterium oryctis]MCW3159698.1 histidine kinase [Chryseobacterium oryctis]